MYVTNNPSTRVIPSIFLGTTTAFNTLAHTEFFITIDTEGNAPADPEALDTTSSTPADMESNSLADPNDVQLEESQGDARP